MKTLEEIAEEFLIRQGCQRMDCDGENCNFFEDVQPKDLIEFAKWQAERMYSEEELKYAIEVSVAKALGVMNFTINEESFKQFKKK
jgi:hypothetical protein